MEWWWVKLDFNENLDKMHVKLFPNFTSFSFDYLGIILEYHGWQITITIVDFLLVYYRVENSEHWNVYREN